MFYGSCSRQTSVRRRKTELWRVRRPLPTLILKIDKGLDLNPNESLFKARCEISRSEVYSNEPVATFKNRIDVRAGKLLT